MSAIDVEDILAEIAALAKTVDEIAEKLDEILHMIKMSES